MIDTRKAGNSIRRYRRCRVCERKYMTMESFVESVGKMPAKTKAPAPTTKKRKIEVRRRLEDLKNRVPGCYIEDDEY